jgi:nucleoside-diphosphate-sugar epimerase
VSTPRTTESQLVVAVTGPTGTFGQGLLPLLQDDDRIERVVGIARRPFDPTEHGWTKMDYRQGDVRDRDGLEQAFAGADVVVHLAFLITGNASRDTIRAINVEGTLNAFRAAAAAGVRRFVYASSVAAYGFHSDNPIGMTEDWPVRPAARLFYAQEKAELERLLADESAAAPELELYLLRPPIVVGPHALGAKAVPGLRSVRRSPLPVPLFVPSIALQLIHEKDVGTALVQCIVAAGPPGAYNISADGVVTMADIAREFGLLPVPLPSGPAQRLAGAAARLPFLPPAAEWVEAASHPTIVDTTKAHTQLHWTPQYTAREALRDTFVHS